MKGDVRDSCMEVVMPLRVRLASLSLLGVACVTTLAAATYGCSGNEDRAAGSDDNLNLADLPIIPRAVTAGEFDQEIDHPTAIAKENAPASVGTFKQRYWYTT